MASAFLNSNHFQVSVIMNLAVERFLRFHEVLENFLNSMKRSISSNSDLTRQKEILEVMWSMWFQLPNYGRRANQFVDLVGFFTIKCGGGSPLPNVRLLN